MMEKMNIRPTIGACFNVLVWTILVWTGTFELWWKSKSQRADKTKKMLRLFMIDLSPSRWQYVEIGIACT